MRVAFPRPIHAAGMVGGDESFSRVPYDELKAAGITALIRYVDGADKGMDRAEFLAAMDAGFCLAWVKETFEQAASLGYSQGAKEARAAYTAADALGWPRDRPGYFVAEDPYPVARSAWPAVADYFRAVHDVDPGRPRPGAYGSGALCAYLAGLGLVEHQWHVSTWPGVDRAVADIVQEANGLHGYGNFGGAIDLNTIRDDNPDWGQHPITAPPAPSPQEDDMDIFDAPPERGGGIYVTDGDRAWGVPSSAWLQVFFFGTNGKPGPLADRHLGTVPAEVFDSFRDRDGKVRNPGVVPAAALAGPISAYAPTP